MDKQASASGPAWKRLRQKCPAWPTNVELVAKRFHRSNQVTRPTSCQQDKLEKPSASPSRSEEFCLAAIWASPANLTNFSVARVDHGCLVLGPMSFSFCRRVFVWRLSASL